MRRVLNPHSYERIDNGRFFIGVHYVGSIEEVPTGVIWHSNYGHQGWSRDISISIRILRNLYWSSVFNTETRESRIRLPDVTRTHHEIECDRCSVCTPFYPVIVRHSINRRMSDEIFPRYIATRFNRKTLTLGR